MKLLSMDETEVYTSDAGYVCISQVDNIDREPRVVCFTPEAARIVADQMQLLAYKLQINTNANGGEQ